MSTLKRQRRTEIGSRDIMSSEFDAGSSESGTQRDECIALKHEVEDLLYEMHWKAAHAGIRWQVLQRSVSLLLEWHHQGSQTHDPTFASLVWKLCLRAANDQEPSSQVRAIRFFSRIF